MSCGLLGPSVTFDYVLEGTVGRLRDVLAGRSAGFLAAIEVGEHAVACSRPFAFRQPDRQQRDDCQND